MTDCRGHTHRNTILAHLFLKPLFMGTCSTMDPALYITLTLCRASSCLTYTHLSQVFPRERPALPKPSHLPSVPMFPSLLFPHRTCGRKAVAADQHQQCCQPRTSPAAWWPQWDCVPKLPRHGDLRMFAFVCNLTAAPNNPINNKDRFPIFVLIFFLIQSLKFYSIPGLPQTHVHPALASQVLGLQA